MPPVSHPSDEDLSPGTPVSASQQPPCATQHQFRPMAGSARHLPDWPYLRTLLPHRRASRSALLLPYFTFGPSSRSRGTTMAAADFWRFIPTPLDAGSPRANRQTSPGITHSPSRLCLSDIRHGVLCKYRALQILACSPRRAASIRSLFVRPALCLQLPPDSASRRTPLPFS